MKGEKKDEFGSEYDTGRKGDDGKSGYRIGSDVDGGRNAVF